MEILRNYFTKIGFEGEGLEKIIGAFSLETFEKNDFVVEYGKISKHIGFVKSGMFQYYVLKDGEERTHYVNIENTWPASLLSFINETPASENIRALTDGSIYLISKPGLRQIVAEV